MYFATRCLLILTIGCLIWTSAEAQSQAVQKAARVVLSDADKALPGARFHYYPKAASAVSTYHFRETSPVPFTGLAVGWSAEDAELRPDLFHVEIRSRDADGPWSARAGVLGYLRPEDSPSGLYWSTLYVTDDGTADSEFEVRLHAPADVEVTFVKIFLADARAESDRVGFRSPPKTFSDDADSLKPEIIPRSDWWGNLPAHLLNPTHYTPEKITIGHAIVHHTVTANNPPDPPQVVRNIWDWHVNGNGWFDIGYNFLVDQFGNIFQGRYNPWLDETDIRGAHAGRSNSQSMGVALLGQFHPGASPPVGHPDSRALASVEALISWRFFQRGLDPLETARINVNPSGSKLLPRISGHRDVSATACPGDNLYTLLPDVRANVAGVLTSVEVVDTGLPSDFTLEQNYPNPFNPSTVIEFSLPVDAPVTLKVYNLRGQEVAELLDRPLAAGRYKVTWESRGLATGTYVYRLVAGEKVLSRSMLLVR